MLKWQGLCKKLHLLGHVIQKRLAGNMYVHTAEAEVASPRPPGVGRRAKQGKGQGTRLPPSPGPRAPLWA